MKARPALSRALFGAVTVLGAATLGADCQGNIVQDPTFRDWCGSSLCSWQTDFGHVARVPTWDENDFGVSFLDNGTQGTQISQATQENQATCILFTSVGDIDPTADMSVSVDFDSDGTIDYSAPLGAATWHRVQTEITAPVSYQGITFYVTKSGTGTAVLAEMTITSTTGCTAPPTKLVCPDAGPCGPSTTAGDAGSCAVDGALGGECQ